MSDFKIGDAILVRGEITHVERNWVDVKLGRRFYTRLPIDEVEPAPPNADQEEGEDPDAD